MKTNVSRRTAIEKERAHRLDHIAPQLIPGISLREDALGQALRAVPAVRFLRYLENEFIHTCSSYCLRLSRCDQAAKDAPIPGV